MDAMAVLTFDANVATLENSYIKRSMVFAVTYLEDAYSYTEMSSWGSELVSVSWLWLCCTTGNSTK